MRASVQAACWPSVGAPDGPTRPCLPLHGTHAYVRGRRRAPRPAQGRGAPPPGAARRCAAPRGGSPVLRSCARGAEAGIALCWLGAPARARAAVDAGQTEQSRQSSTMMASLHRACAYEHTLPAWAPTAARLIFTPPRRGPRVYLHAAWGRGARRRTVPRASRRRAARSRALTGAAGRPACAGPGGVPGAARAREAVRRGA